MSSFTRNAALCGAILIVSASIGACSDDDDSFTGGFDAGEDGDTASGGSTSTTGGRTGSGGSTGRGGAGGSGGGTGTQTGGAGGTQSGGASNSGGRTQTGGAGGTVTEDAGVEDASGTVDASEGDAASDDASADGDATNDSSTPDSTTGRAQKSCAEACSEDEDCRLPSDGDSGPQQYVCESNRCVGADAPDACVEDADCVPSASGWTPCDSNEDCTGTERVCVDVGGGNGQCAFPTDAVGCFIQPAEFTFPLLGGDGATATVCGTDTQVCGANGTCEEPCVGDLLCGGLVCIMDTGRCGCDDNSQCDGPGTSVCNLDSHQCECASDSDCDDWDYGDICVDGKCACSTVAACTGTKVFEGSTLVCEE